MRRPAVRPNRARRLIMQNSRRTGRPPRKKSRRPELWKTSDLQYSQKYRRVEPATTCILHIGGHKTGSTSIQAFLDGYQDDSLLYARFFKTRGNHSYPLWLLFSSRLRIPFHGHSAMFGTIANAALRAIYRLQFTQILRRVGSRKLILSGEGMANLDTEELSRLRDYLKRRFSNIRVIGYARPAVQLIPSLCQQSLKFRGDSTDIDGVIAGQPNYSYRAEFAGYYEVFGEASVDISLFDRDCLIDGSVVTDFCSKLDIPVDGSRVAFENEALPFELVQLMYIFHRHRATRGKPDLTTATAKRLLGKLAAIADPALHLSFSEAIYRRLFANMADDLAWAEARFGAHISAMDPPESHVGMVSTTSDLREISDSLFDRLVRIAPSGLRTAGLTNNETSIYRILEALSTR